MPTYDYVCAACGHHLEAFQSMTAKPLRKCPSCGANKLERQIGSGAGILFKGSGFYETDYRSSDYKKSAESAKKGPDKDAKSDKGSGGKSDGSVKKGGDSKS